MLYCQKVYYYHLIFFNPHILSLIIKHLYRNNFVRKIIQLFIIVINNFHNQFNTIIMQQNKIRVLHFILKIMIRQFNILNHCFYFMKIIYIRILFLIYQILISIFRFTFSINLLFLVIIITVIKMMLIM